MSSYYSMTVHNSRKLAVAQAKDCDEVYLWELVKNLKRADDWPPLVFTLGGGQLGDLLSNNVLGRICSSRIIEVLRCFENDITWLPVSVCRESEEWRFYFMHFFSIVDVLDDKKTTYAAGRILRPHLSKAKIGNRSVFCLRPLGNSAVVRDDVKAAIEAANCTGIEFEKIPAS
jgi:hypothetical protein